MNTCNKTVLYVGGFALPDKNAAAQRVIANAQLFAQLGFDVIFINHSDGISNPRLTEYFGFSCYEFPQEKWNVPLRGDINQIKEILARRSDVSIVVAYNYPAVGLIKLKKLCRQKDIVCLGDITEWYRARDVSLIKMPIKYFDTFFRMRVINRQLDGLIVISNFLKSYYDGKVPCVNLPPLVDSSAEKWQSLPSDDEDCFKLVYAGNPSRTKERLDVIIEAVKKASCKVPIALEIVGISKEEYGKVYGVDVPTEDNVVFYGRLPHEEVLNKVSRASYTVIMRDDNRVTKAGFPTKFAESITCGTPVICNDNSDLKHWVKKYSCGFVVEEVRLDEGLVAIYKASRPKVDRTIFDYRRYLQPMSEFLNIITVSEE